MTSAHGPALIDDTIASELEASAERRGTDPVTGILFAVGGSLLLWGVIAQLARWAAHTVF